MKVRVLKLFQDKYTKEWYKPNQEIEISKERFNEILEVDKLVEEIEYEKGEVIRNSLEDDEKIISLTNDNIDKLGKVLERIQESAKEEVKPKKETKKKKK